MDALQEAVGGRPVWTVSYDVWLERGPAGCETVHIDAITGEVVECPPDGTDSMTVDHTHPRLEDTP